MQLTILRGPKGLNAFKLGVHAAQHGESNPFDYKTQTYKWLEWHRGFDSYEPPEPVREQPAQDSSGGMSGKQIALLVVVFVALIAWNALFVGPLMAVACVALVLVLAGLDAAGLGALIVAGGAVIALLSVL